MIRLAIGASTNLSGAMINDQRQVPYSSSNLPGTSSSSHQSHNTRSWLCDFDFAHYFFSSVSCFTLRVTYQRSCGLRAWSDIASEWFYVTANTNRKPSVCNSKTQAKTTHDIIPDEKFFSGAPSSVGTISNAAKIPAIFVHMLRRAKKRPGHNRAPNPNAWFGNASTFGDNQRSG